MKNFADIVTSRDPSKEIALLFAEAQNARERAALQRGLSALTGWSRNKVYDLAKRGGWSSGRKPRSDRGRWALSEDEVKQLAAMARLSKRKGLRMTATAEVVLDVAAMNGLIGTKVSVATLNRYLRELNLSKREMRRAIDRGTHTHLRSNHPNHEWQVDVTPCVQFYFNKRGLKIDESFYDPLIKNKNEVLEHLQKRHKILRYVIIDHYSGAFYVRYYESPGENMKDALDFIIRAMQPKSDPDRYPFRGVPLQICADRGGAFKNFMLKNFLEHLDCNLYLHAPEEPNRKGVVEGHMNVWEQQFESRLSFERISNLAEMNLLAEHYCLRICATAKHSRHGHTRTAMWATIRNEQLRNLPDIETCRELIHLKPETRLVTPDRNVSYKGKLYFVADPALIDKTVIVRRNPYAPDEVTVEHEGIRYACPLDDLDEAGFRKRAVEIGSEEAAPEHAHAVNTPTMNSLNELPDIGARGHTGLTAFRRDVDDIEIVSIGGRKRGEDIDVAPQARREFDNTSARIRLLELLKRETFTAGEIAWLESHWTDTVTNDQVEQTARELGNTRPTSIAKEKP